MSQDLHHELAPETVERCRQEAKILLRAVRGDDQASVDRVRDVLGRRIEQRFVLADALHVLAYERGYRSWPALKHTLQAHHDQDIRPVFRVGAFGQDAYARWAERLLAAARSGEPDAATRLRQRVPRLSGLSDAAVAEQVTPGDASVCLAREYGFRTWAELAEATDRARDTHYSGLPPDLPWKQAEAAINAGDTARLRELLARHPGLESEDPGMTLLVAAAQPEAGKVPRELVDLLIEAGSGLDDPLSIAACFNKADMVGWLLDAGADPAPGPAITALQSAAYNGSRDAADVLVARTGILPDAFYLAAAAGDVARLARWFDRGRLRPSALRARPDFTDVGWPGRAVYDDADDVLAEGLAFAAHLGRDEACSFLLDRGARPDRAPLYGITPLHFAASMGWLSTAQLLIRRGAPLDARDALHDGTPADWAKHSGHLDPTVTQLLCGNG